MFFLIEAKLVDVLWVPAGAQWVLCSEPNGCSLYIIYALAYRCVSGMEQCFFCCCGAGGIRKLIDFVLNHVIIKSWYYRPRF